MTSPNVRIFNDSLSYRRFTKVIVFLSLLSTWWNFDVTTYMSSNYPVNHFPVLNLILILTHVPVYIICNLLVFNFQEIRSGSFCWKISSFSWKVLKLPVNHALHFCTVQLHYALHFQDFQSKNVPEFSCCSIFSWKDFFLGKISISHSVTCSSSFSVLEKSFIRLWFNHFQDS